jgi:hypothetical protein
MKKRFRSNDPKLPGEGFSVDDDTEFVTQPYSETKKGAANWKGSPYSK